MVRRQINMLGRYSTTYSIDTKRHVTRSVTLCACYPPRSGRDRTETLSLASILGGYRRDPDAAW
jgi:hypothetical protein